MSNPTGKGGFGERKHQINRDGRPKGSKDLGALFRRIGHEIATKKDGSPLLGSDGKPMTVIEAIARQWAQNPKLQAEFVDRGWGPVPNKNELTGADSGPIRMRYDLSQLTDEEIDELDRITSRIAGNQSGKGAAAPD